MCVACDKRFHLTSGLESAGNEASSQNQFVNSDKRFNLTPELEIARHALSPQNQIAK